MKKPPNKPKSLRELLWYIRYYESTIFIRGRNGLGEMDAISLRAASPEEYAASVANWIMDGHIPVRVRPILARLPSGAEARNLVRPCE